MLWKNKKVNISNYAEVFKDYSKPVQEVIRGAILDDTPLEKYIDKYSNDYHLLWEVKMALDEGFPESFLKYITSYDVLRDLRRLSLNGYNVKPLLNCLKLKLSNNYYRYIFKWYEEGIALEKYKFSILPEKLLGVFDYGLSRGIEMNEFNNGVQFTDQYIRCCIRIKANGKSITKFLNGDWDIENLELLSTMSKSSAYDDMIESVHRGITPSVLEEIYKCCVLGIPASKFLYFYREDRGYYDLSGRQVELIREAYKRGLDYNKFFDSSMSIVELNRVYDEMVFNSMKKISGRL